MIRTRSLRLFAISLALIGATKTHAADAAADARQCYELRVYSTQSEQQQRRIVEHWKNAAVPAYNRIGVKHVGVFTETQASPTNRIYVLLPFHSVDAFAAAPRQLLEDAAYQKAAAEYVNVAKAEAAFERMDSALLTAFDGMKQMTLPPAEGNRDDWVFELRTYFSPSENRGWNKIKMFNDGEIAVMREAGLAPIFFAQNLTGSNVPALTYMTCGKTLEEHQKHWRAFGSAPGWIKLRDDPQYKDNMTGMTRVLLKRTAASQL